MTAAIEMTALGIEITGLPERLPNGWARIDEGGHFARFELDAEPFPGRRASVHFDEHEVDDPWTWKIVSREGDLSVAYGYVTTAADGFDSVADAVDLVCQIAGLPAGRLPRSGVAGFSRETTITGPRS
jgi:hypothetical protein